LSHPAATKIGSNRCPYTAGTFTSGRIISRGLGKYKHFLNNSGFPESVMNWDFVPSWPYHLGQDSKQVWLGGYPERAKAVSLNFLGPL
jgi:hypothetical protein